MLDYILNGIKWSKPEAIDTRNGLMLVQKSKIPEGFWNYWNAHKSAIQRAGISPSKHSGNWELCKWSEFKKEKLQKKEAQQQFKNKILHSYQVPHARLVLDSLINNNGAIDGSDTGTGKTFVALSICKYLKMMPVVLCSKSGIHGWKDKAKLFKIKPIVYNYEQFKLGNLEYLGRKDTKKIKVIKGKKKTVIETEYNWTLNPERHLLIFDEAHKCQTHKSLNSKMLEYAAKQNFKTLLLSATLADNPLQLYSSGMAINLFKDDNQFWRWCFKRGVRKSRWGGMEFKHTEKNLKLIHDDLFPKFGGRLKISEIEGFPETLILPECYTMEGADEIQELWEEAGILPITKRLRQRQAIELLKIPTFIEMTEDAIAEGNSVALFLNFRESIKQIAEALKTDNVIHGDVKEADRKRIIELFQSDKERVIILQTKSGGESIDLHDVTGKYPRLSLISFPESAKALIQLFGRVQRSGGLSKSIQKIIFCADTVEEIVAENLRQKIKSIHLINDGVLDPTKNF
jgi:superfamily II DNA or RNA helicase